MRVIITLFVLLLASVSLTAGAQADTSAVYKKSMQLFDKMNMSKAYEQTIDVMLTQQIKENPSVANYKDEMKSFFQKYMGWDAIKNDLAAVYAQYFTADEIDELIKFYSTSAGQKLIANLPEITQKGMQIAREKLTPHLAELEKIIEKKKDKATHE